jgi:hypothetical protein
MSIVKFPTSTPEADDAMARDLRFRRLESEVCDIERMGEIAYRLVGEWLNVADNPLPREAGLAVYAVQQVGRALKQFKAEYYRAWGPGGEP